MTDKQLCAEMARVWVDGGGDADGFLFCLPAIQKAIANEQSARDEAAHFDRQAEYVKTLLQNAQETQENKA